MTVSPLGHRKGRKYALFDKTLGSRYLQFPFSFWGRETILRRGEKKKKEKKKRR